MTGTVSPESSPKEVKSLTKHSIVLIPKGQCLKMFFPKGLKVAAFHFNACDILGRELFENQNQIYLLEKSSAWIRLFKQFLVKPFSKNLTDFMNALLGEFHKDFAQKEEVEDLVLTSFKPLFDLLEHSPPATLSVKKIAQAVGKSEGALSKAFNRLAGVSLKAFLLKQTLQKVERELIYSLKPMKEIAADLGFYDEFAFSKFSKRHLGLAPSHFREKHQTF
jgi:AraC-like DNA-binding protein